MINEMKQTACARQAPLATTRTHFKNHHVIGSRKPGISLEKARILTMGVKKASLFNGSSGIGIHKPGTSQEFT